MNITYASDDVAFGTQGGSGGSGSSASSAGGAANGSNGSNGTNASGTSSGGNGSNGVSGGSGASGSTGTSGNAGTTGVDETSALRNVKGQVGLLQIGGTGGEGGAAGQASAGTDGGVGGAGGDGGNGGTTGAGGDGGDGGNGGNGGNGADGGNGGVGAAGGSGNLTITQSNFTATTAVIGATGGNASAGQAGQSGGNGGAGNSGGEAGVDGLQAAGGLPGNGGNGGNGGKGGNGGNGAAGAAGGTGSLTLNNTTMTVKNTLTVGGDAGQGSDGGDGGTGGTGGDAGQTAEGYIDTNITGEAGDSGKGGTGGAGGNGGKGADGGDGGDGTLTLTSSVLTAQSIVIGGNGADGGNGGNSGSNGKSGTADTTAAAGSGAAGGQGGNAGDAGSAGTGALVVENSTLNVTSGIQIGGNGGNGGDGGDRQGSNAAGTGGDGSDGASGTLTFTNSVINNTGTLTLGGQGGDAGDGGTNNGARGRSGNGGAAGNGGTGTAIFESGSGQIASDIQLGGQNGSHDGVLNNSTLAQSAGLGGAGILEIHGGTFTAGTLTLGVANLWSALTDTLSSVENQFLQSGGTFQVGSTVLNSGSITISDGIFASQTLEANQGTLTISGDGTAIFGSTELNANSWQESVALMQQNSQLTFNGMLVLSGDTTLDLSSTDLNWRVGGDEYTYGLGDSSLTVLNARSYIDSGNAALAMGYAQIDSDAYLLILTDGGVTAGESFTAVTGSGLSSQVAPTWQTSNISTTSRLLTATQTTSTDATQITIGNADLSTSLSLLSPRSASLLSAMSSQIGVDVSSDNAAQQFLSKAADVSYVSDAATAARLIDSAINLASIANVAGTSFQVISATVNTLSQHLSMGQHFFKGTPSEEGFNLWTALLYDNSRLSGYHAGGFDAKTKTWLGGIFIGGEDTLLTNTGAILKTGGSLNIGKGKSKASGSLYPVKNDIDFWGASLYGSWINGNWNLIGDVNYSKVGHSIKQSLDPVAGYSSLTGDTKSTIISAGLTREYVFETDYVAIIPHIGIRYTILKNKEFNANDEGQKLFKNSANSQSLWSVPLGISFTKEYKNDANYTLKPALDLTYIATGGDTISGTKVSMDGVSGSAWSESRITDSSAYSASAGLLLQKDNLTYGLSYGIQQSSNETSQTVSASFNLKF